MHRSRFDDCIRRCGAPDEATLRRILAVNAEASFLLAQGLAHGMVQRGFGRINDIAQASRAIWSARYRFCVPTTPPSSPGRPGT